jgi:hypothetical protein
MGAATPGIHLRWLPGARVEFPYRERTMGVEFAIGGYSPMGVGARGIGHSTFGCPPLRWGERDSRVTYTQP